MTARSFSMATTVPLTTVPSMRSSSLNELVEKSGKILPGRIAFGLAGIDTPGAPDDARRRLVLSVAKSRPCPNGRPRFRGAALADRNPGSIAAICGGMRECGPGAKTRKIGHRLESTIPLFASRPRPLDDVHGRAERGFYIHIGGVEQVASRREPAAGRSPRPESRGVASRMMSASTARHRAPCRRARQARRSAACAGRRRGGDVELHGGVGQNHRADVAAVEHRARRRDREVRAGGRPSAARTCGMHGDARGGLADVVRREALAVERGRGRAPRPRRRPRRSSSRSAPRSTSAAATAR